MAAQLISSAPSQPCSSAEREELSTNLEELEAEQEEEEAAILQLESQLDELVVTIRQLEEQVEGKARKIERKPNSQVATLTSQLVDQLGVQQIDGGETGGQVSNIKASQNQNFYRLMTPVRCHWSCETMRGFR